MNAVQLTRTLAHHVGWFDCHLSEDGRELKIRVLGAGFSAVGKVDGTRLNVHITNLFDYAPEYLQPLVGRKFDTQEDLKRAVREVAFLNEAQVQLKGALRDALIELARTKPPGLKP